MRRRRNKGASILIIISLIILICASFFIMQMRPLIKILAINEAEYIAIKSINDTVNKQILENYDNFDNLVLLEKDKDDKITAVKTNMQSMNLLKTQTILAVYETLNSFENLDINVPLGAVISSEFFATMGPNIPIKLINLSTADATFKNAFESTGINQTRHTISLEVSADMSVVFPFGNEKINIKSEFIVMETILMGSIPESYTYIDDTRSETLAKVNDYSNK